MIAMDIRNREEIRTLMQKAIKDGDTEGFYQALDQMLAAIQADLIRLCEKHSDCQFLCFTNATLIDEAFADEMLRVKNFIPAISLEGFEEATDGRRGDGVYQKVIAAMQSQDPQAGPGQRGRGDARDGD